MDKRLKRIFFSLHAQGLSAQDITNRHNRDPRKLYTVTTMEVADVLREMGAKDPHQHIPQKPAIQPDMPKRFIPIQEAQRKRQKLTYQHTARTNEQKAWHQIMCGFNASGKRLLKSGNRHDIEKKIREFEEKGWTQVGNITTDFYANGETYMALVQKGETP